MECLFVRRVVAMLFFDHDDWIELLCVPAHRPIKPVYIKKFISLIKMLEVNDEST